jgi:hypothetical protein
MVLTSLKGKPADLNRRGSTARQRGAKARSAEHWFNSRRAAFVPVRAVDPDDSGGELGTGPRKKARSAEAGRGHGRLGCEIGSATSGGLSDPLKVLEILSRPTTKDGRPVDRSDAFARARNSRM